MNSTQKNPDDVVITLAIRTPLTKGKKGGLKDTPLDGIVFKLLQQVIRKMNLDPQMVEDICLGNVRGDHNVLMQYIILTSSRYRMPKQPTTFVRPYLQLASQIPPVPHL